VFMPAVGSRVEQRNKLASPLVPTRDVWTFVPVAVQAGKSKVFKNGQSPVLAGDDVVGAKRQRVEKRGNVAILTALAGAFSDLPDNVAIHEGRLPWGWRASRALDRMIARKFPMCR
jgi:hypothetical protein